MVAERNIRFYNSRIKLFRKTNNCCTVRTSAKKLIAAVLAFGVQMIKTEPRKKHEGETTDIRSCVSRYRYCITIGCAIVTIIMVEKRETKKKIESAWGSFWSRSIYSDDVRIKRGSLILMTPCAWYERIACPLPLESAENYPCSRQ